MLSVIMMSVRMLNVVMLSVAAPWQHSSVTHYVILAPRQMHWFQSLCQFFNLKKNLIFEKNRNFLLVNFTRTFGFERERERQREIE
jgi:hypothetical protein